MFPVWRGEQASVTLRSGDRLAIVSDGVMEAGLREDLDFGEKAYSDASAGTAGTQPVRLWSGCCRTPVNTGLRMT